MPSITRMKAPTLNTSMNEFYMPTLQDDDAGLKVKLERFYEWIVNATPFKSHEIPAIK